MAKQTFSELYESDDFQGYTQLSTQKHSVEFTESFTNFLNVLNNKTMSRARFEVAMEEAVTTTDFPLFLGNVVDQQMIAAYNRTAQNSDFKQYMKIGTAGDFRKYRRMGIWGLDRPLKEIKEQGEYQSDTMDEGELYLQIRKYGKQFGLSWEATLSDRIGAFSDVTDRLSRGAIRTETRAAINLFAGGNAKHPDLYSAPNGTIQHPIDKGPVTNSLALPLTNDNLAKGIAMLRRQVDIEGEPLLFSKVHLVVSGSNEFNMWSILSPNAIVVSGGDATAGSKAVARTSENMLLKYNIVPHVEPYLEVLDPVSGKGSWYLFLDPSETAALEFDYLSGNETPKVMMKSGDTDNDGPFSFINDTQRWKVRTCFGGGVLDPRATVASIVNN